MWPHQGGLTTEHIAKQGFQCGASNVVIPVSRGGRKVPRGDFVAAKCGQNLLCVAFLVGVYLRKNGAAIFLCPDDEHLGVFWVHRKKTTFLYRAPDALFESTASSAGICVKLSPDRRRFRMARYSSSRAKMHSAISSAVFPCALIQRMRASRRNHVSWRLA